MRPRRTLPALALAAALVPAASATDLLDVWRAAATQDPEFTAARAAHAAGQARRSQAAALWRPQVALQAGAAYATQESAVRGASFSAPGFGTSTGVNFDTSVTGGTSTQLGLSLRQPLYNRELRAQGGQLAAAADMAEQAWRSAQQQLMLRSAERYFDAALAAQQLRLLREQEQAVVQARTEAQDRFRIGDRPVTDVHEATARAAALGAQRIAAQSQLEMQRGRLADLMGAPAEAELALPAGTARPAASGDLQAWLARAERESPQVLLAQARVRQAEEEAAKTSAALSPTVDLLARAGRERISGSGDFGAASQTGLQHSIGVQLTIPLSTGMRGARQEEARALLDEAQAQLQQARQQAAQQTRAAWLELAAGDGRTAALEDGLRASQSRLDATRVGLQAGDRTTLDLLNAQNDAAAAELALLQSRAQQLLQRLRLAAHAGSLDEAELAEANRALARAP